MKEDEKDAGEGFVVLVRSRPCLRLPASSSRFRWAAALGSGCSSARAHLMNVRVWPLQLNKFCVTPRHFLLVTKEFVRQTTPLSPIEIYTAWSILKQLSAREKHLAFFNCGADSGAS